MHTNRVPQYLSDCVQTVSRSNGQPGLRSSDTAAYVKPRCRTRLGERGFSYAGPTARNSLPAHLHQISDTSAILKLNYSIEHIVASFVSAPGPFVNSAVQIPLLLLLNYYCIIIIIIIIIKTNIYSDLNNSQ